MNNEENILLKIFEEVKNVGKKVTNLEYGIKEIKKEVKIIGQRVTSLENETKEMKERVTSLENETKEMKEKVTNLEYETKDVKEEARNISGSVARIEKEHGEKLSILFDAYKANSENIVNQEETIESIKKVISNHDDIIYILNSKVENL